MNKTNNFLAVVYALLAVAMWSTVATAFKLSLAEMSILQLLTGASFFSLVILGFILLLRRELRHALSTLSANLVRSLVLAVFNPILYYFVLLEAYNQLPAQVAQSLNYTWAISLTLLSVPILKHTLNRHDAIAIFLGYIGVICIAFSGKSITGELHFWGIFLALISTIIWSGYWLYNRLDERPATTKLFHSFLLATPILIALLFITGWHTDYLTSRQLLGMAYIGLFEMGIAFTCWQMAMAYTEKVSQISILIFLSPFISLFIINTFLNEPIHILTIIGLILIIIGIFNQQIRQ